MSDPNVPPESEAAQAQDNGAPDALSSAELEALRARAAERDQYLDLLQRTQADFENYQKRNQREREQERKYYHRALAFDLLPVVDNLARALADAEKGGSTESFVQGVKMVHTQLLDVFKRHGITPIAAQGQPFNPELHQALMQQPAPDQPPHTVIGVLEPGYTIHDRVLRPARVIVSAPAEE